MYSVNMKTGYVLYLFTVNTKKGKKKFMKNKKQHSNWYSGSCGCREDNTIRGNLYTAGNLRKIGQCG